MEWLETNVRSTGGSSRGVGGGGLQPLLNFQKKNSGHPRGRCDRLSCYFIKQCVLVCVEWCCSSYKDQFSQDYLAEADPKL